MSYQTDNIAIAAALSTFRHRIQELQPIGRRAKFVFEDSAEPDALEIHMGRKLVDAINFHEELRRLSGLARSMSHQANAVTLKAE